MTLTVTELLVGFSMKPLQRDFDLAIKTIRTNSTVVEDEARAASYVAQQKDREVASDRHREIIRAFPDIEIRVKSKLEVRSIPVGRNPKFYGRTTVLEQIFRSLKPRLLPKSEDQLACFSLHGMGGVGKTQTATEFAYRYIDHFPVVIWFRAETPALVAQEFADAAKKVGAIPKGQAPDVNASIELFKAWLFETSKFTSKSSCLWKRLTPKKKIKNGFSSSTTWISGNIYSHFGRPAVMDQFSSPLETPRYLCAAQET